jgi:hypothetical protein
VCLLSAIASATSTPPPAGPDQTATPAKDTKTLGKYLVQICTLSDGKTPTFTCTDTTSLGSVPASKPPPPGAPEKAAQSITLKLCAGGPPNKCTPPTLPLLVGDTFYIQATADSGLPVAQRSDIHATAIGPASPNGVQKYEVETPGNIVITATRLGNDVHKEAPSVTITFAAVSEEDAEALTCKGLLPLAEPKATSRKEPQTDLPAIVSLIGSPAPLSITAEGKKTLLIYSSRSPDSGLKKALTSLDSELNQLAPLSAKDVTPVDKAFTVELEIPHAKAFGDPAARISGLNYSKFTVEDIGNDKVRITATTQPDCPTWTAFLTSIRHLEWQLSPEPFQTKLFYLFATDAASAFATLAGSGSAGSSGGGSPPASSTPSSSAPAPKPSSAAPEGSAAPGASPSSKATPGAAGGGARAPSSSAAGVTPPKPIGMAAVQVAAGTTEGTFSDLLVFSDADPGDDAQIQERERILAQLDLPRPEMIINAWVMQNSTADPRAMGAFTEEIRQLVEGYNQALEELILNAWGFVSDQTRSPEYFDDDFYHYITDRYVADANSNPSEKTHPKDAREAAEQFLSSSGASIADTESARTGEFGICKRNRYCLGYNTLFQPLKPHLTDVLLTLIAAAHPYERTQATIDHVQGPVFHDITESVCETGVAGAELSRDLKERCRGIWNNLDLSRSSTLASCAASDYRDILGAVLSDPSRPPRIHLECFAKEARVYLHDAGLLRADLADFLFNYKHSQQYPHEFQPYELSQSADALNAALSPLVDAFNRDVVAFQTFMRADVQYRVDRLNNASDRRCCVKRLFGLDKPSFYNDGIITVRTISGQTTTVNTTSQSALDASSAPTLANLASAIASPTAGTSTGTSPIAGLLGAAQPEASTLLGVLNAYQSASLQIGRQLNLTVTPRALSTASAAEINVVLNADETSGGPIYSGGPAGSTSPNLSRVANHDISTRIRVESVKLFELSSFSAVLERSRSRFPLLPPFVEIPYIGTFAGIPIPGAKEYHSSTAVISALVVPTAADIGYGLRFVFDKVLDGPPGPCTIIGNSETACRFRTAVSLHDLKDAPIHSFHKAMINCFATGMKTPYSGYGNLTQPPAGACESLSFDRVLHDAY